MNKSSESNRSCTVCCKNCIHAMTLNPRVMRYDKRGAPMESRDVRVADFNSELRVCLAGEEPKIYKADEERSCGCFFSVLTDSYKANGRRVG